MATSSASEMKVQIEPLDGSNYLSWKFNVKLVLMQSGLWGIVSGAEKAPVASEDDKKEKEIVDFRVRSEKAYSQIALNVKKELQVHVANTVDPKNAWDQLKKHFEFVSITHTVRVCRAFYAAKMAENGNLMEHITYMTQLSEQLREMKEEVSPKKFAIIVLGSLPESYDTFLTSLNARDVEQLTWDSIKPALVEEYLKKKEKIERHNTDDALFMRGNYNDRTTQHGGNRGGGNFRSNNRNRHSDNNRPNSSFNSNNYQSYQQPRSNNRGGGASSGSKSNKQCWGCGGYDHIFRECDKNKEEGNIVQENNQTPKTNEIRR